MTRDRPNALNIYRDQLRMWRAALPEDAGIQFELCVDRLMQEVDAELSRVSAAAADWSRVSEKVEAAQKPAE